MDTEQLRELMRYLWCSEEESDEALQAAVDSLLEKARAAGHRVPPQPD